MRVDTEAPLCLPPSPLDRLPRKALSPGTVDCHMHVFGKNAPLANSRSYTPQIATLQDYLKVADALGIARAMLVQPSVYGFDNSVLLAALAEAPNRLRGIAVVSPDIEAAQLARLHERGIRGLRINTRNKAGVSFNAARDLARKVAPLGWSMQFQVLPWQLEELAKLDLGVTVVLDHLGFIAFGSSDEATQLGHLRKALERGTYAKISGPYRLDASACHVRFGAAVRRLSQDFPDQLLWASDWPHTELWANPPHDADLVDLAVAWIEETALRENIFVRNAERLFWS
jgi:predicted TIM-barrel fold metal-dependent hydrolase